MGINNVPTTIEKLSPNKNRNILNVKSLLDQKYLQVLLESAANLGNNENNDDKSIKKCIFFPKINND